jgi:ABC-type Fe3+ transport system permease subunit
VKAVYGLYADGQAAQQAVNRLRAAGLSDREITILSSRPMEDYEFGHIDSRSWIWWIACGGALVGMVLAILYIYVSATGWEMNVGGLPVIAWWPAAIITFELTMLGAIISTVITLVITAGLGRGSGRLYDPEVSDGKILVGVENPPEATVNDLQTALGAPPGARVKTL